ncbi:hypothetical protein HOK00_00960 [bacterium]|nr:hypothetical protein [bacterium]
MKNYIEEETNLNITPIVDVFLILMVVFISFTFVLFTNEDLKKEELNVPSSKNQSKSIKKELKSSKIEITKNNKIIYKKRKYSKIEFLEKIKFLKEDSFDIIANKDGSYDTFFQIISELKSKKTDTKINLIYKGY